MQKMYPAVVNSPKTELVGAITDSNTEIEVADVSVLLQPEGLAVIGNGEGAETIQYTEVDGNILKGCIRGFQGTAKPWGAGTRLARNFTAYDHDTFKANIEQHDASIVALEDRLNTADTDDVVLQPGLQVINAAKDTRFKLGQITGKTEINYEGRIGLIGVENPYVINTAGNLLPPFYEWGNLTETVLIEPYEAVMSPTVANRVMSFKVPIAPGEVYTLSAEHNGNIALSIFDHNDGEISSSGYQQTSSVTVQADANVAYLRVYFSNLAATTGTFSFKNPILIIGTEPQPFMPQHKSMLAFDTELHANPSDGTEPDILFEQNGEYKKLAKWKKVVLDGSHGWLYSGASYPGYKRVSAFFYGAANTSQTLMKYNGTTVPRFVTPWGDAEEFNLASNGEFLLTISNTDSGWGDAYTPTQYEIKAYFMGWKMWDGATKANPYNGIGTKNWYPVTRIADAYDVQYNRTTLPTDQAPNKDGYAPYQLLYRLAKETIEPVVTEGSLLLSEGDNMVEVGTGIVLRERANPYYHASQNRYYINNLNFGTSLLNFKSSSIIAVYKDSTDDATWHVDATPGGGANLVQAYADTWNYDQAASYSVTYTKLDKSPIQPISGSLAANEKAQISDLTVGVAEALQRVSVVEQKKAEKDAPGWLSPTLLNGWTNADTSYTQVGYTKDGAGVVHLRGMITGGVNNATVARLPRTYRPSKYTRKSVPVALAGGIESAILVITPTGEMEITYQNTPIWVEIDVSFLAEQ
ncbi:hypothetical protein [Paenibacillus brevis]|uniref:Uncharacterized protein n=1 Tax=Paenibacillus brevis TaxID=2841508 RepID=A0ABS6FSQ1_9BACL|nr:hypothetical protein [Paenibacillus brevis]MBU5673253.1 hypothetical protein [Paenibacillus brevis]